MKRCFWSKAGLLGGLNRLAVIQMLMKHIFIATIPLFTIISSIPAEPIVLNGAMVPELLGAKIASIRVLTSKGQAVPFQIDEVTRGGEYVCPQGEAPNADSADGILDKQDEIVFLLEDTDTGRVPEVLKKPIPQHGKQSLVQIRSNAEIRTVVIVDDNLLPRAIKNYLRYDHARQFLETPFYYAQFGKDRFHFIRAGCMDFTSGKFVDLTNELRVEIKFTALWGLLPIHYTEENIVCKVRRYKAGPVRLIRRGDFYLELGLGIKGSKAIVYQFCYPELVKVPVRAYLPLRFSLFFREAYIEMTPVIRKNTSGFRFVIPGNNYSRELDGKETIDTLIGTIPKKGYLVTDGVKGFEWVTALAVDDKLLDRSGYVLRKPSGRSNGAAECGFRLAVNDLPRGSYDIVNWVFFPEHISAYSGQGLKTLRNPAKIISSSGIFSNLLTSTPAK